jgi:predicted Zn-dependent protease
MIFSRRFILLLLVIVLIFSACGINPVTGKREINFINEQREIALGRNASYEISKEYGVYNNTALESYVNDVGQQLVSVSDRNSISYEFHVVDMPFLNAFALPGGYIYITRGLLAELDNEAQLASVLGHEIGHVCARHSASQLSEQLAFQVLTIAAMAAPGTREMAPVTAALTQSITLGYSREKEFEADAMGLAYMYRAGYDPIQASIFLSQLSRMSQGAAGYSVYTSTHPDIFDRISATRNEAKQTVGFSISMGKIKGQEGKGEAEVTKEEIVGYRGKILEDEYKSHLDGLLYGPREAPRRLRIYTVKEGDTIESIAEDFTGNKFHAKEIAEINKLEVDSPLRVGQKLKIII